MDQGIVLLYIIGIILVWIRVSNGRGFPADMMSHEVLGKINALTPGGIVAKVLLSLVCGYLVFAIIIIKGIFKLFQIITNL